ncbi:MAG: DUF4159 domain-containing protein [Hyphomonadaceae bacterium]
MTLGPLFFAAPWALAVLGALPLLYFVLRATPPAPRRAFFPPLRLLLGLRTEEENRKRAPLWLVLLRALAAALMILGFARPSLAPQAAANAASGPVLIAIDDGWTAAPGWAQARAAAEDVIAEAERAKREIFVLTTAPQRAMPDSIEAMTPGDARARLARLDPAPWRPDRARALARLEKTQQRFTRIIWISDGLDDSSAAAFARGLQRFGPVTARLPARLARAVTNAAATAEGVEADIRRAPGGLPTGAIAAETLEGRSLGAAEFKFSPGAATAHARVQLPPEIAARAARVRIVGEASAGAVRLLPAGSGRPLVGLVESAAQAQPLLSDLFYVERAITPFASARRGEVRALIDSGAQAIVLPDASRISPPERDALDRWLKQGGLLVRFAGPRLANASDDLVPGPLRPGSRALGGALAWEKPQAMASFPPDSPFDGLALQSDVSIRRQVLADPAAEREARVWARLEDGAPLVTAAARGKGLIVLFHVTAGPAWSDLPLSGLYVDMLRRTLAFAGRAQTAREGQATGPWIPERLLDGYGSLAPARNDAQSVPSDAVAKARAGPDAPPGLYGRAGAAGGAIDAAAADEALAPLRLPGGIVRAGLEGVRTHDLAGPLLALAAALIALDLLLALALAGRLPAVRRRAAAAAIAALALAALQPPPADAAPANLTAATLETRLAYVRTGDARRDRLTAAGLETLTEVLRDRTAVEPGPPIGVDPARDDLSPYPILYWAAPDAPERLSDAAVANLDRYMRLGGLILIDTRDGDRADARGDAPGPAAVMLQGLDTPPLEQIGAEHVLSKTFYLLKAFPGRFAKTRVWAESANAAMARDGVPALIIGDGDWATIWATSSSQRNFGFVDSGNRQQEMALRFGVNLVMLALTGNYKSDQVHVPALLERLGEQRREER